MENNGDRNLNGNLKNNHGAPENNSNDTPVNKSNEAKSNDYEIRKECNKDKQLEIILKYVSRMVITFIIVCGVYFIFQ